MHKSGETGRFAETILLVEDDEPVRKLAREVLENCGYQLLEAANGIAAISIGETYDKPIHLLVTDLVMPGMGGQDLAERFAQLRTGTRVLYISGHPEDVIAQHGILGPGTQLLEKPFTPDDLARKVRAVLDGPG
jgi:CheY-like chemotaxis protein